MANTQSLRKMLATVRGIERNWRLGRYEGRNSAATSAHHENLLARYHEAERALPREARGLLVAEHDLAKRVSERRDAGTPCPDLRARLAQTQRALRALEA